jgi:hypothetical protein
MEAKVFPGDLVSQPDCGLHICLPAALLTRRGARYKPTPPTRARESSPDAREGKLARAAMFMVGPYPIRRAFSRQVSCRFVQNVFPGRLTRARAVSAILADTSR